MSTRRYCLVVMLMTAVLFAGCSPSDSPTEKKMAEAKRRAESTRAGAKATADSLARKSDAVVDWKNQLGSIDFAALNRVYSVDIARVWIGPRPILFLGVLDDVALHDHLNYHLFVRDRDLFFPEVRLHLTCAKDVVAPILTAVKKDKDSVYPGAIAVTARIARVQHEMFFDQENTKHIFVGHGQCVDIAYVGDSLEVN